MDEDEVLSKITRLLEQGCTMLASHHDCGAPLFRCQGEIVCPVCSFPDEPFRDEPLSVAGVDQSALSGSGTDISSQEREASSPLPSVESPGDRAKSKAATSGEEMDGELLRAKTRLRASLIARLDELSFGIETEQDLDKLKKLLDCAEGLMRVLRSL